MLIILACLAGVLLGLTSMSLFFSRLPSPASWPMRFCHRDKGLARATAAIVIPAVSLQAGYMIGLTGRDARAASGQTERRAIQARLSSFDRALYG